jgi:hypothetical protein
MTAPIASVSVATFFCTLVFDTIGGVGGDTILAGIVGGDTSTGFGTTFSEYTQRGDRSGIDISSIPKNVFIISSELSP